MHLHAQPAASSVRWPLAHEGDARGPLRHTDNTDRLLRPYSPPLRETYDRFERPPMDHGHLRDVDRYPTREEVEAYMRRRMTSSPDRLAFEARQRQRLADSYLPGPGPRPVDYPPNDVMYDNFRRHHLQAAAAERWRMEQEWRERQARLQTLHDEQQQFLLRQQQHRPRDPRDAYDAMPPSQRWKLEQDRAPMFHRPPDNAAFLHKQQQQQHMMQAEQARRLGRLHAQQDERAAMPSWKSQERREQMLHAVERTEQRPMPSAGNKRPVSDEHTDDDDEDGGGSPGASLHGVREIAACRNDAERCG